MTAKRAVDEKVQLQKEVRVESGWGHCNARVYQQIRGGWILESRLFGFNLVDPRARLVITSLAAARLARLRVIFWFIESRFM